MDRLLEILLAPVLLVQGRRVRRDVPKLPEADGPRSGGAGTGPDLRVLVAGDSAAAGVGVARAEDALAGRLVHELYREFSVRWRVVAKTGWTTRRLIEELESLDADQRFDVVVTSLGVNDVTRRVDLEAWRAAQARLRDLARERFGAGLVVVSGLPPVHGFPALPQPLRWWLGRRASTFDRALQRDVEADPDATFVSLRFSEDRRLMASDGFHPGPAIYATWASLVGDAVKSWAWARE